MQMSMTSAATMIHAYTLVAPSLISWCPKVTYARTPKTRTMAMAVVGNMRATRENSRKTPTAIMSSDMNHPARRLLN